MVTTYEDSLYFENASEVVRSDREVVLAAVSQYGWAIKYASAEMRRDRQIVRAAMENRLRAHNGLEQAAILLAEHAEPPLNQDPEMLKLAGLEIEERDIARDGRLPEIVLSVRFSIGRGTQQGASFIYQQMRGIFRGSFYVHFPNAYGKGFCGLTYNKVPGHTDEQPTLDDISGRNYYGWCRNDDTSWRCQGQCAVRCWKKNADPLHDCREHANDELKYACWRLVYRRHLERAKDMGGCMVQVREGEGVESLGRGQVVELEMAAEIGVRVVVIEGTPSMQFAYPGEIVGHLVKVLKGKCTDTGVLEFWNDDDRIVVESQKMGDYYRSKDYWGYQGRFRVYEHSQS